jgi:acylpyruvate hydrolase
MKIIAVGRNYANHAKELNNPVPEEPVIFTKPDTAILKDNQPFYYPSISNDIHHEIEIFARISKNGKNIAEKFAPNYYDGIGLAIDFTARDLQQKFKSKGLPWDLAKGFDNSCPISSVIDVKLLEVDNLPFYLNVNGVTKQTGNTKDMLFSLDFLIAHISKYFTLKKGDIILTGTPEGVGPVNIGDRLEGFLGDKKLLNFEIK